jgi:hypothetical protein
MMENVLDKIDYYSKKAYNLSSNIIFFPVRHHSPVCSFHLRKVIKSYKPEIILIEGPCDAGKVMEYISHGDTKAPVCIYYSYSDSTALVDEEKGKYRCYYPFLDYSPELVALREARNINIPAEFIDLSYAQILINSQRRVAMGKTGEKNTYNDDYFMDQSAFIQALCEKESCRSYNELWEKLFEIDGLKLTTEKFIKNMITSCYLSRVGYNEDMLREDGCIAREIFMVSKIRKSLQNYNRILVVSGGFHTSALIDLIQCREELTLLSVPEKDEGVYAMAYSFQESDQLKGYASGMPHPAFYQKVWDNILEGRKDPYESAVLHFIVRCGSKTRKSEGGLSTADEIEAFNMAKGLRILRGKNECGVYELYDAVKSSFIKGELNISTEAPMKQLIDVLTGRRIGELCSVAEVPPIVQDFRAICRMYKLKSSTLELEAQLYVYKNKKHRDISRFFHSMKFLETGFCKLDKGPDLANRKNTNLVREIWKYKYDSRIEGRLIELSVQGGTVKEAATAVLCKEFSNINNQSGVASLLLIQAYMMGIEECFEKLLPQVLEILNRDSDFISVVNCCYNLNFLYNGETLMGGNKTENIRSFLLHSFNRAVHLLTGIYAVPYEIENDVIKSIKDVYHLSRKFELGMDSDNLKEALKTLTENKNSCSAVEGAAWGILYGLSEADSITLLKKSEEYLYGTGEKLMKSGSFLKGLFSTSKEIMFTEDSLIKGIDNVLRNMGEEEFLSLVPDLRLCFTFFTPGEIDDISKSAAKIYCTGEEEILYSEAISAEEIRLAAELDCFGLETLKKWNIRTVI